MKSERQEYPIIGGIYEHYKGGRYEVITLAKHTETEEILVICKSIHFGSIHARPLTIWLGVVNSESGVSIPRFQYIEKIKPQKLIVSNMI